MVDVHRRRCSGQREVLSRLHLPKWRAGGVNLILSPVGGDEESLNPMGPDLSLESTLINLRYLLDETRESVGSIAIAQSPNDVRRSLERGTMVIVPALEGCQSLGLTDPESVASILAQTGIVFAGLTWNRPNQLGAGAACPDAGLTPLGKRVLPRFREMGLILDLAHASTRTFWDALDITEGPILVSHTASQTLRKHCRNIDDRQARAISERNGLIGVCLYPAFLVEGGQPDANDVIEHILHFMEVAGPGHVAIGADFIDYAVDVIGASLASTTVDYGSDLRYPSGLEEVTKMGHIGELLAMRGCSPSDIAGVMGRNFLTFWERADTCHPGSGGPATECR